MNIDACRVPGIPPSVPQPKFNSPTGQIYGMKAGEGRNGEMSHATGRWPANLVLQHLDGCDPDGTETIAAWACAPGCPVAALDVQSGVSKSTGGRTVTRSGGGNVGSGKTSEKSWSNDDPGFGDTGGASRFFHQSHTPPYDYFRKLISPDHLPDVVYLHVTAPDTLAKENDAAVHAMTVLAASTDTHWIPHALRVLKPGGHLLLAASDAEPTNDTLICAAEDAGFEVRDCIFLADSVDDRLHYVAKAGKKEREAGLGAGEARKNTHPTVKPVAVMRRLLAGVRRDIPVLDPFVGSGTTLLACVAEGCDGIGVEREGEYFAIATARVDARVSGMLATRTDGEARVEWVEEG